MSLANQIKKSKVSQPVKRTDPVWKGPEAEGITVSLLSRFLVCRERFRLLVVEGLKPVDSFSHRLEYGQMWHLCEEALASKQQVTEPNGLGVKNYWEVALKAYAITLCRRYPTSQDQIDHWYRVCKCQFPLYVDYWSQHPDVKERTPLFQEKVFCVPYTLPSGRVVKLRGKWDAVDLIGKGKDAGVYLQENKTKGDVDIVKIERQLLFDLQTMLYIIAFKAKLSYRETPYRHFYPIKGVRYNVVRRPLSGGKGTIRQHQPTKSNPQGESKDSFYARLSDIIKSNPSDFFMRRKVDILPYDIDKFKRQCLDPVLEQLCDWYEWVTKNPEDPFGHPSQRHIAGNQYGLHFRFPYGTYSSMIEGTSGELDAYMENGSEVGLQHTTQLFPELE